jgi:hypothetical protein
VLSEELRSPAPVAAERSITYQAMEGASMDIRLEDVYRVGCGSPDDRSDAPDHAVSAARSRSAILRSGVAGGRCACNPAPPARSLVRLESESGYWPVGEIWTRIWECGRCAATGGLPSKELRSTARRARPTGGPRAHCCPAWPNKAGLMIGNSRLALLEEYATALRDPPCTGPPHAVQVRPASSGTQKGCWL